MLTMTRTGKTSLRKRMIGRFHIVSAVFGAIIAVTCIFFLYSFVSDAFGISYYSTYSQITTGTAMPVLPKLDTVDYDRRMQVLALATTTLPKPEPIATTTATGTVATTPAKEPLWPAKTVYPNVGAILPFHRIVAYYGNFYSKGMGILGELSEEILRVCAAHRPGAELPLGRSIGPSD